MRDAYKKLDTLSEQFDIPYQTLVKEYEKELERVQKSTDLGPKKTASFCVQSTDLETLVEVNAIDDNGIFMITTTERLCHQDSHSISKIQFLDHKEWVRINNIGPNSDPVDHYLIDGAETTTDALDGMDMTEYEMFFGPMLIKLNEKQRQAIDYVWPLMHIPGHPFKEYHDCILEKSLSSDSPIMANLMVDCMMVWHKFVTCDYYKWLQWAEMLVAGRFYSNRSADKYKHAFYNCGPNDTSLDIFDRHSWCSKCM